VLTYLFLDSSRLWLFIPRTGTRLLQIPHILSLSNSFSCQIFIL